MTARLLAVLGLLVGGLVLATAAPANACSCVTDQPDQLAANAEFAFLGVLEEQRADDDEVAHRFAVETVYKGDVHRTQDVVTPHLDEAGCGVEWEPGSQMVVLGYLDDEGRLASNFCSGSGPTTDPSDDAVVAALGTASEPLSGQDLVELDLSTQDLLRWSTLAVVVIGLAALGVMTRRRWRRR